ncbi:MAG: SA1788 family PVL leukocidin-associated protein [Staphylococcus rostri]|uniref:SA1788 family PVL leukocidin-associated protein n=1 Tax=Staphylococcus rostri TaxID=522262 RepID=UPI0026DED2ED|nr:SA1788 family PVL leukocidin-associated protein [Staphylococcus rostri]MDO5375713.1 SA1788 family PVL leukocidin-associated protein [Staphylococcus rostri]
MLELPRIPKDRSKKYEYKGQKVSVNQMAKYTGLSPATIRQRLRNGSNVSDILKSKKLLKLELTEEQVKKKKSKNITTKLINERLSNGWSLDLAIELSPLFIGPVDNIVYKTTASGTDIEVPYEKMLELEKFGITSKAISVRVGNGMSLEDAIDTSANRAEAIDFEELEDANKRITTERLRRYREEKRRKAKPHLNTVPQKHKLSSYGSYLMNRPGIARTKVDLYGNRQFI